MSRVATLVDKSIGYSLGVHKGARLGTEELRERAERGDEDEDEEAFDVRNAVAKAPAIESYSQNLDIQERYFPKSNRNDDGGSKTPTAE